jgi:3-hydroxyisobutyrate dehydrogenase
MKVGFIGLGHLGKTIAQHLIAKGVPLSVWNRTLGKSTGLGVPVATSPRQLISSSDVVIINLFDSKAVKSVFEGPDGLLSGDCTGKIIIDTTTNHCEDVLGFHRMVGEHGGSYLECTLLGSVVPASQGSLTILVSGEPDVYDQVKTLLETIGTTIHFLGEPAMATKMKLINNLVLGSFMATCAEAVALGESAGLGREQVINILLSGAGNSMVLNAKKTNLARDEFPPQFSTALIYKDLHYLQDLCRSMNRPLFTGSIVKELYAVTQSKGFNDQDFSAIYRVFRDC